MVETTRPVQATPNQANGKRFWWGLLVGALVMVALPLVVVSTGAVNMAATQEPGAIERSLGSLALNTSAAVRAPTTENPFTGDPTAIETGLTHFRDTCLLCHGAPGIEPHEFARGLNPQPPELSTVLADWSDGELFWLTKHGIRMTGMPAFGPTHGDEEIWQIVAFVRQLPSLKPSHEQSLQEASWRGHQDGSHGATEGGEEHGGQSEEADPGHDHNH